MCDFLYAYSMIDNSEAGTCQPIPITRSTVGPSCHHDELTSAEDDDHDELIGVEEDGLVIGTGALPATVFQKNWMTFLVFKRSTHTADKYATQKE